MACKLLFVQFVFIGLATMHSVFPLGETDRHLTPAQSVPLCKKCPPGYSTYCPKNESSRCIQCMAGTFSENPSRKNRCRPCSRCKDNEFEVKPCTLTSNVKCKECSKCGSGFVVLKPCEGTRDTVCEKCTVAGDDMSYDTIGCNENRTEDHFIFKKQENLKGSMKIIEVEQPWPPDKRKPKHPHEVTVDENHPKVTLTSSGSESVNPTPSSVFPEKGASLQMTLPSHSKEISSSRASVDVSSKSIVGMQPSVEPASLTPTLPGDLESPPMVQQHTKPTTKTGFDTNTEEPSHHEMQADQGNLPRHTTRRSVHENNTKGVSSASPSESNMLDLNPRGMLEEHSTGFSQHYTLIGNEVEQEMPVPEKRNRNGSKSSSPSWRWGVVVVATVVGILLLVVGVGQWKQCRERKGCFFTKCPRPEFRRPRCPPSDCCDGVSVSSVAGVHAEQNPGNSVQHLQVPASVTIEHESEDSLPNSNNTTLHTYLPETIIAQVHHSAPSVFEVFNIRPRSFITEVENNFNSSGGKLTASDSDVMINIDSGAVPEGVNQPFFFRVVNDERSLLRDIPETPDRTLISPVIQCGPENINLFKPVEIIVPHCLYLDEVKKDSIAVYRCGNDQLRWEKVPSASERNCQSKCWFTVKKDSVHIRTKTFSFWAIFACGGGGPKKKNATVFARKPNSEFDRICFRFYIYSDNKDSKKRVKTKEQELFPGSMQLNVVPFKMFNDSKNITVTLTKLTKGWEMDPSTESTQIFPFETAYRNGFRSHTSCEFAVEPQATGQAVDLFSGKLTFQQVDHNEHFINLNPGFAPIQSTIHRSSEQSASGETPCNSTCRTSAGNNKGNNSEEVSSQDSPAQSKSHNHCFRSLGCDHKRITQEHCNCICTEVGAKSKKVLRNLGIKEEAIENLEANYTQVEEQFYKGLWQWSKSTQSATTKTLCDALHKEGCSEALKTLSKEGVTCDACASIPESNPGLGTCV